MLPRQHAALHGIVLQPRCSIGEAMQTSCSVAERVRRSIGDDMLCTNPVRIQRAIDQKAVNSLLLKLKPDRHCH